MPACLVVVTGGKGGHLWVLPGLPRSEPAGGGVLSPAKARAVALALAATRLPELEVVVADAGRLQPGSVAASLLEAADLGVLAARQDYLGAVAARRALDAAPGRWVGWCRWLLGFGAAGSVNATIPLHPA